MQYLQNEDKMSVVDWLVTFLICAIPLVNIIMIILWACSNEKPSRKNYCIVCLIFWAISILFSIMTAVFGLGLLTSTMQQTTM
jgi:hypothetical protein